MKILLVFGLSLAFTSHSYTDSMSFFERGGQACSQHTIALCAPVYGSANGYVDCTHTLAFQHLFAWAKCVDLCKQCVRASLAVTVCECIEICVIVKTVVTFHHSVYRAHSIRVAEFAWTFQTFHLPSFPIHKFDSRRARARGTFETIAFAANNFFRGVFFFLL